ncbi:MAG TPA: biotin/lipoyl-binding protein [Desulfobacterales bacterium]|nr:biotin/lipoyl-binding protein [Desulfobacterales bacterium]
MKKTVTIILALVLVAAAVGLLKKRKTDLTKAPVAAVLPVVVDTMTLRHSPVTLTLPAMGVVTSDLSTILSTKISGRITHVYKQEGDSIKKGDKLASIDASDLTARKKGLRLKREGIGFQILAGRENIKALKSALSAAQDAHARTLELLAVKGASQEQSSREVADIAGIKARIATAKNGISTLQKSKDTLDQNIKEIDSLLRYTVITAPIDGTLSKRLVMTGDLAMPGKPLFKITARTGLYVNLSLPDTVHADKIILRGKEIPLTAKNEASTAGLVQYIAPVPDNAGLVEGQYLNIKVVVYQAGDVLIPIDGLLSVGGESFLFVYGHGRAVKTRVNIVARGEEGLVVRPDMAGKTIILAKPDILLRASAGVPVLVSDKLSAEKSAKGKTGRTM